MKKQKLAISLMFFMNGFLFNNWISRLPLFQTIYDLDYSMVGTMLLVIAVGALVAMPTTGYIIIKYGSRKITILAAIFFACCIPFIPVMPNLWTLSFLFFSIGVSTGMMDVAMNAQAVVLESRSQKSLMAAFHGVFSAGAMIGAGCGALFTWLQTDFFVHLSLISAIGLATILWSSRHLLPDERNLDTSSHGPKFQLPAKALLGLGIIAFCSMLGESAMHDWSTNYLRNVLQAKPAIAPLGLAVFNFFMMIGRFNGDWARTRFGDYKLLIFNSLVSIVGIVIVVYFQAVWVVILGIGLVGCGLSVIVPITYSRAGMHPGISPGVGIAMITTIGYAGFIVGPPMIGFVADAVGLRIALSLILGLFLLMLGLSFREYFGGLHNLHKRF